MQRSCGTFGQSHEHEQTTTSEVASPPCRLTPLCPAQRAFAEAALEFNEWDAGETWAQK